jgi:hypothetical protein
MVMAAEKGAASQEGGKGSGVRYFGAQAAWVEEPDVVFVRYNGRIDAEPMIDILHWIAEWAHDKPYYILVGDLSNAGYLTPSLLRLIKEFRAGKPCTVSICFGASFTIRVIADMVHRARRYLVPGREARKTLFVATEEDARAMIAELRSSRVT